MAKKNTSAKINIEKYLHNNPNTHFTAAQILKHIKESLPSINLSTIHRNLSVLAEENKVSITDLGTGVPVFESTVHSHHHLVCCKCAKTTEMKSETVSDFFEKIKLEDGFNSISTNHLIIYGICIDCASEKNQ